MIKRYADGEFLGDLLDQKLHECHYSFIDDIMENGIQNPILIGNDAAEWLENGHHRLAVAVAGGVEDVPVMFGYDAEAWNISQPENYSPSVDGAR